MHLHFNVKAHVTSNDVQRFERFCTFYFNCSEKQQEKHKNADKLPRQWQPEWLRASWSPLREKLTGRNQ